MMMMTLLLSTALSAADGLDARGNSPLHQAALTGSLAAVETALREGANPKAANAFGITAMHNAAPDAAKVRVLLAAGAEADPVSAQGRTPLMIAAAAGAEGSVKLLLARGADVQRRDKGGATALLLAAVNNHEGLVRLLAAKGADVTVADQSGYTALHYAAAQGTPELVRFLLARGAKPDAANTFGGRVPKGEIALKGLTPLMLAAPYAPVATIRALLDAGANPNAQDSRGMTPLMFAAATERQDPAVLKLLLARGARAEMRSGVGETALDWARKFNQPGALAVLGGQAAPAPAASLPPFFEPPAAGPRVQKSLALLETSSQSFFREGGCFSCHHSVTTALAQQSAATHGMAIDQTVHQSFKQGMERFFAGFQNVLPQMIDPPGGTDTVTYMLTGMAAAGVTPSATTEAMALYLGRAQHPDGTWNVAGIARPPVEDGALHRIALAYSVLDRYFPAGLAAEKAERLARARRALERRAVRNTDDAVMKLAGLVWAKAPTAAAVREVLRLQRADGSWGANPHLGGEAYSTATAVWALREAGAAREAVERGAVYLLMTQKPDGSWRVRSRAPKFQPTFDSGFPHGEDQWVSNAATAWAVRALAGLESAPAAVTQQ